VPETEEETEVTVQSAVMSFSLYVDGRLTVTMALPENPSVSKTFEITGGTQHAVNDCLGAVAVSAFLGVLEEVTA
jgi:hypothetical protein